MQTTDDKKDGPIVPPEANLPEITPRVVILGVILTVILAAANAYLGLKLGTTVSASIPAAVISMGVLRLFKNANILENNMVQTMASVGEALTAGIAFILPALLIVGAWNGFHYWQTVLASLLGGGLGVLFTIPLRRALLQDKTLRYPEGVAIGNVLKASATHEQGDLKGLIRGGMVGAVIALFQSGFQILTDSFAFWVKTSTSVVGFGLGLSPALIAAGYIVGLNVALSLFVGIMIGWLMGIPLLTSYYGITDGNTATDVATNMWHTHVRYIGVGTMLIGGLWTLGTLFKPVFISMRMSFAALRQVKLDVAPQILRTERDIPIHYVLISLLVLLIPLGWMIMHTFMPGTNNISAGFKYFIATFSTLYVLIVGFIFCSISAYFAGLIGSTNNPVSGLLVSTLLLLCLALIGFAGFQSLSVGASKFLMMVAIGSTVVIAAGLAISNDTMQDLKVGEIVGATPWKQQVMLILGVIVSAFVIPPILQLLYQAYGIGGIFPRAGMNPAQMLAAPQAGLMATVTEGAFNHQLPWSMIRMGAFIAIVCIIIDEILKKKFNKRLPVLAVGLGIYLPLDASTPCVIGGILAWVIQQRLNKRYANEPINRDKRISVHSHQGLLLACGIVAGASIMGVMLAIPFALKQSSDALCLMPQNLMHLSGVLSIFVTAIFCGWIYHSVLRK